MKKLKILLTFVAVSSLIFYVSCRKQEQVYSCDSKANEYARMNAVASQSITRDSLVKLERGLQFAVFRSLSPENKKRIYNEKIDLLLGTLQLSAAEKAHLQVLRDYFEEDMYEHDNEPPFLVAWVAKAKSTLDWDEDMIQGMVGTWATPEELQNMAGISVLVKKGKDCTCKYDISCAALGDCRGGCDETRGGCGITGTANCTGNCPEDRITPSTGGGIAM